MTIPNSVTQLPQDSILDVNGRQTYLGNTFVLPTTGTSLTDTSEHPLCLIVNPSSSSKSFFFYNRKVSTNNNTVNIKYYFNPTVNTLGSATTPVNIRSGATFTSLANCYLAPTITANGTFIKLIPATIYSISSDVLLILDPGTSLLVTGTQVGAGTTVATSENVWYEI